MSVQPLFQIGWEGDSPGQFLKPRRKRDLVRLNSMPLNSARPGNAGTFTRSKTNLFPTFTSKTSDGNKAESAAKLNVTPPMLRGLAASQFRAPSGAALINSKVPAKSDVCSGVDHAIAACSHQSRRQSARIAAVAGKRGCCDPNVLIQIQELILASQKQTGPSARSVADAHADAVASQQATAGVSEEANKGDDSLIEHDSFFAATQAMVDKMLLTDSANTPKQHQLRPPIIKGGVNIQNVLLAKPSSEFAQPTSSAAGKKRKSSVGSSVSTASSASIALSKFGSPPCASRLSSHSSRSVRSPLTFSTPRAPPGLGNKRQKLDEIIVSPIFGSPKVGKFVFRSNSSSTTASDVNSNDNLESPTLATGPQPSFGRIVSHSSHAQQLLPPRGCFADQRYSLRSSQQAAVKAVPIPSAAKTSELAPQKQRPSSSSTKSSADSRKAHEVASAAAKQSSTTSNAKAAAPVSANDLSDDSMTDAMLAAFPLDEVVAEALRFSEPSRKGATSSSAVAPHASSTTARAANVKPTFSELNKLGNDKLKPGTDGVRAPGTAGRTTATTTKANSGPLKQPVKTATAVKAIALPVTSNEADDSICGSPANLKFLDELVAKSLAQAQLKQRK